jgi:carboxymethylenebutenolidase
MTILQDVNVGSSRAALSLPAEPPIGGVLILPAIYGIEGRVEHYCSWLNARGLATLVWDPFAAHPSDLPRDVRVRIALEQTCDSDALREQLACLAYLRTLLTVDRVAVLGFCTGARMALTLAAADPSVSACVAYHPSIISPPRSTHLDAVSRAAEIQGLVLAFYPGGDTVTEFDTFKRLRDVLEARTALTICGLFPRADHGFTEIADPAADSAMCSNPGNAQAMAHADAITESALSLTFAAVPAASRRPTSDDLQGLPG